MSQGNSQQVQQSTASNQADEQSTVIAEICAGAPTDAVRDCLRKYDPKKTSWHIERDLKKDRKEVLVAALDYLGLPNMNQYKAEALPHELVCRIQNLFPDTCQFCKQSYCIKLDDKPILSCIKCGQGCHKTCVLQIIGKEEEDLQEANNFGEHLANPYSALGLFYICHVCQKDVIPQKETLKVRSRRNSVADDAQSDALANTQHTQTVPPASEAGTSPQTHTTQPGNAVGDAPINTATVLAQQTSRVTPNNEPPVSICKHYRTGRCKYGISGKKDGTCAYRHPKVCNKFLNNGLRRRGGCNRGENCNFFHPQMCHSSLQDRTCLRDNCKFMHVRGTRRADEQQVSDAGPGNQRVPPGNNAQNTRHRVSAQHNNKQANSSTPANTNAFLDSVKMLQDQMAILTTKMQQMEASKWNWNPQQLQGYQMAPRYPHNMQPIYQYQMPPQMLHPPPTTGGSPGIPTHQ